MVLESAVLIPAPGPGKIIVPYNIVTYLSIIEPYSNYAENTALEFQVVDNLRVDEGWIIFTDISLLSILETSGEYLWLSSGSSALWGEAPSSYASAYIPASVILNKALTVKLYNFVEVEIPPEEEGGEPTTETQPQNLLGGGPDNYIKFIIDYDVIQIL
jgi:hypothetical protein